MTLRWMRTLATLLAAVIGAWCSVPALAATNAPDAAVLYHNYCSVCHGDRGDGKSRATGALSTVPRDFTSAASKQELTRERIALAIAHGRPGTAMTGWKTQLSANDIERLAEYVHTRFVHGQGAKDAAGAAAVKAAGSNKVLNYIDIQ